MYILKNILWIKRQLYQNDNFIKTIDARTEAFHSNEYTKAIIALMTKKRE